MQFKVPQNIDMADRVVGSLTLVQFLYLLIGGIIVYFLFTILAPVNSSLFVAVGGPTALFFLALAFLKIQDQPFPKFVGSFFVYLAKPKMRVWYKEGLDPNLIITPDVQKEKPELVAKKIKRSELARLTQVLDTGGHISARPTNGTAPHASAKPAPPNHLKKGRPVLDNVRKGELPPGSSGPVRG